MNITLIGMPGVGKSTIGSTLAKETNFNYIDIDDTIESKEKKPLQKVLSDLGDEKFILREEKEVTLLNNVNNTIISTGGSIVYSEKAMNHLKNISKIIFLRSSIKKLKSRIKNRTNRGIVGLKENTFESIFEERNKLYTKYADLEIDCEFLDVKKIVEQIKNLLLNRNL